MPEPDKHAERSDESQKLARPAITAPKGGGAIRGMGEKFAANPVTGTGSVSVPIATSPGRSGFGPQLGLTYDSGSGNGPFGVGWSLSVPAITRKTDKGLPEYRDGDESDVYVLAGAEDLVPVLRPDGTRPGDATTAPGYVVHRYRPRVEGLFARIERWTEIATGEIHWRSITRGNVTTVYGKDDNSRITDFSPAAPARVFSWLVCESYDDRGNAIVYEYVAENGDNVDLVRPNERNRVRGANRYLKRIRYGNRESRLVQPDLTQMSWLFEVVFDYDEGHYQEVAPDPAKPEGEQLQFVQAAASPGRSWTVRPDPFSSYRAGFEVRTYRRCRRVLMFHHFPDLPTGEQGYDGLVRSTEFDYADLDLTTPVPIEAELAHQGSTRFASFLRAVTQSGYVRDDMRDVVVRDGVPYTTYVKRSLPPLEFGYSKAVIQQDVRELDPDSVENLPAGLDQTSYRWIDLDGEGVSGILTEQAATWYYKPNLGEGRFGALEAVAATPSLAALTGGHQQLLDLAGDGNLDLVALAGPTPGFYKRTGARDWAPFRAFRQLPVVAWDDPNLRFVDLDGDGHADVLITEQDSFTWHPSLAEDGFSSARIVHQPVDEERGPRLVFADGTQSLYLADMSGDGLTDLVRIRNGEVCYWPNLGYGRFGAKVTMDNAPLFDDHADFDQRRIRLADVDGSGTTDVAYLACDGVRLYFNQSGNRLSDVRRLDQVPRVDDVDAVTAADLLGNGTACLVWSSPLPADERRPLRYVDLMGGTKPHLLIRFANNLGAETEVQYAPSTRFYLADKRDGRPWITRLPFPVHVVERVITHDRIGRNRFVTRYAYHHGYFDGVEREFRGFGMVEQWDTEELAALTAGGEEPAAANVDAASHVPPVLTRMWFHTGVYDDTDAVSRHLAAEYYGAPDRSDPDYDAAFGAFLQTLLPDTVVLPASLTPDEEREAVRALKGSLLRQEIYGLDGTDKEQHPYTVAEQNFTLRALQPRGPNRHAVFFAHPREAINYHHERSPDDPRVAHVLTLELDAYGNVLKSATIGYGRWQPDARLSPADQARQAQLLVTYTENRVTKAHDTGADAIDERDAYRAPVPCETRTYELTGLSLPAGRDRFAFQEVLDAGVAATALAYEQHPTGAQPQKRLIEHVRTYFRRNDFGGPLPLGELQSFALPFDSFKLAFTPGLVAKVYGGRVTNGMLDEARYTHTEGDASWWIPHGRFFYSPGANDTPAEELAYALQHFFLPHRYRDPFHTDAVSTENLVAYDGYDLLLHETTDALGNQVTAGERRRVLGNGMVLPEQRRNDYRVLQPALIMDVNRNCIETRFDALGLVAGTAAMGKPEENPRPGDRLTPAFRTNLTQAEIDEVLADPKGPLAVALLGDATTRAVHDLAATPAVAALVRRETHASDPAPSGGRRTHVSLSYSDGFGREIQKKLQAEPGPAPLRDGRGAILLDPGNRPQMTPNDVAPRWIGSGWTVFNNKGRPVRQYEPFFSDTHRFEFDVRIGVSPVLCYDPIQRVVATVHPNHTWEKVVFDAWSQATWDGSDTVAAADPAADADVAYLFSRLPAAEYLPTWHALRTDAAHAAALAAAYPDAADRTNETRAAEKAGVHAGTPTIAYADSVARTFLTVAHNRFAYNDAPPVEELHATRIVYDVEGNQREVVDARDRVVMRYDYDMLGDRVRQASMESGERWTLTDVAGQPLYAWDSRDHQFRTAYDRLRRPTETFACEGAGPEVTVGRSVYGESTADPESANLRGKPVQALDQAGVVTTEAYDFKGNLLRSHRQLAQWYKRTLDWSAPVALHSERYTSSTRYDALNRPTQMIVPHSDEASATVNVIQPSYNEANLLARIDSWPKRNTEPADVLDPVTATLHAVTDIRYDANGRRTLVDYGNGVRTTYDYDPLTFRLTHLLTRRGAGFADDCPQPPPVGWPGCQLQNLHYTYDPSGNLTHIRDEAQQAIFFRNIRVEPSAEYTYDAVYRVIEAAGREHLGQVGGTPLPHSYNDGPRVGVLHPADGNAMGRYVERYAYDTVGNLLELRHRGTDPANPGWSRTYTYEEPSQLEPAKHSNRLGSTTVAGATELYSSAGDGYDAHGSMLRMPHLHVMQWDFKDRLQMTQHQSVNGERTWFVYDAGGQRVRKVTELPGGQVKDERLYLGGFELYRRNGANPLVRETLHIMDDTQRVAIVETRTQGDEPGVPTQLVRFQFANHLGSASLELDDGGQIISYEEYYPYGSSSYQALRGQTETPKRYRYTGKERDDETGLYYHGKRYYAPWLGRWVSCDPAALIDGLCLYEYCSGNPVVLHDPSGANGEPLPGLIGNDPKVGKLWEQAVAETHGPRFKSDNYKDTVAAFKTELSQRIARKGLGSNKQEGTGINYARKTYAEARTPFGKLAEKNGISLEGVQVHHTFDEIAKNPAGALDTSNLAFRKGNAGTVGSGHNFAHEVNKAHEAGIENPGLHVNEGMNTRGIHPDVPELGPSLHTPHTPHTPHAKAPKGKKIGGGTIGKLIAIGIAVYVYFDTGSAYAAVQTVNPAANTTDALLSGKTSPGDIAEAIAKDAYGLTPVATADWLIFDVLGPRGKHSYYDTKLAEKAIKEGRNPLCAQCHGPGGALDPNNEWNLKARYAPLSVLKDIDPEVLSTWLNAAPK
jgi:RHS repeat-associated protein